MSRGIELESICTTLLENTSTPESSLVVIRFFDIHDRKYLGQSSRGGCCGKADTESGRCPLGIPCSHTVLVTNIEQNIPVVTPLTLAEDMSRLFKKGGTEVIFTSDVDYFNQNLWLNTVVSELIGNCTTNKEPGGEVGASKVTVTLGSGWLTVEDNYGYENPQEILETINKIKDSGRPMSTKKVDPEIGHLVGGAGIFTSLKNLRKIDGDLTYYVNGKTIGVKATWNTDKVDSSCEDLILLD